MGRVLGRVSSFSSSQLAYSSLASPSYTWAVVRVIKTPTFSVSHVSSRTSALWVGLSVVREPWPLGHTCLEFSLSYTWLGKLRTVIGLPLLKRFQNPRSGAGDRGSPVFFTETAWSGVSIMLSREREGGFKCQRFSLFLPSFSRFSWINVFSFAVCP